jgi:hypothetical protein
MSQKPMTIGSGYAGGYIGSIDEVAVFSLAASEGDVRSLYKLGKNGQNLSATGR